MLQNEYLVAKVGVDAAENEPSKVSPRGGEGGSQVAVSASIEETSDQAVEEAFAVAALGAIVRGAVQIPSFFFPCFF